MQKYSYHPCILAMYYVATTRSIVVCKSAGGKAVSKHSLQTIKNQIMIIPPQDKYFYHRSRFPTCDYKS